MESRNPYVVYLDTSALLKLYVEERWSEVAERAAGGAEDVLVSEISYLEARASFARLREDGEIASDDDLRRVVEKLDEDWSYFAASPIDADLLREAGALAEKHRAKRLRSYDALHLATALNVFEGLLVSAENFAEPLFLAFDRNLVKAARDEVWLYFDPFAEPAGKTGAEPATGGEGRDDDAEESEGR